MKQNETKLRNAVSLAPEILQFSVPLMGTGILQLLYNAADSVIVGRFAGSVSLAAVGSTSSLVYLFISLFTGVAVGVNYLAARCIGAGDDRALSETVHCSVFLGCFLGILGGLIGFVFAPQCLELMHTDPAVLPLAAVYLRIYFLGVPALVLYNFGAALLRAAGDTVSSFIFMLICRAEPGICDHVPDGCGRSRRGDSDLPDPFRGPGVYPARPAERWLPFCFLPDPFLP